MVKLAEGWYIDHDTEKQVYRYLQSRLQELHDKRAASDSPDTQTPEEVRVIDLIVAMELCHIG